MADSVTLPGSCRPSGLVLQTGVQHTPSSPPPKVVSQLLSSRLGELLPQIGLVFNLKSVMGVFVYGSALLPY